MNYSNEFEERKLLQIHHFLHIVHMNQFMKINHFIILTSTCPLKVFRFLNIEFNIGFCMNIIVRRKNVFFFSFLLRFFFVSSFYMFGRVISVISFWQINKKQKANKKTTSRVNPDTRYFSTFRLKTKITLSKPVESLNEYRKKGTKNTSQTYENPFVRRTTTNEPYRRVK